MFSSRIEPLKIRSTAIPMTAAGYVAAMVWPARRPRYALAAPSTTHMSRPRIRARAVNALLDQHLENRDFHGLVDRFRRVDLLLHEGGFDHPERAQTRLVAGLHGRYHLLLDLVNQGHDVCYSRGLTLTMYIKKQRL